MKYSIVIPCYNEEENIPNLIKKVSSFAQKRDMEIILVENGSKDGSYSLMLSLVKDMPYIKIVKVDVNQGLGYGIQQGINMAEGDYIGWIHADMQTPMEDIEKLFDYIDKNSVTSVMVKATRHNRSCIDYLFTNGMAIFCSLLFRKFLYDIQAVPVVVSKNFFVVTKDMPYGFAFDMYIYLQAKRLCFQIKRIPVRIFKREKGDSSWNKGIKSRIRLSRYMILSAIQISKGNFIV